MPNVLVRELNFDTKEPMIDWYAANRLIKDLIRIDPDLVKDHVFHVLTDRDSDNCGVANVKFVNRANPKMNYLVTITISRKVVGSALKCIIHYKDSDGNEHTDTTEDNKGKSKAYFDGVISTSLNRYFRGGEPFKLLSEIPMLKKFAGYQGRYYTGGVL